MWEGGGGEGGMHYKIQLWIKRTILMRWEVNEVINNRQ